MFKSKQESQWDRRIKMKWSVKKWCQRMLRDKMASLLQLPLQATDNPLFTCCFLYFINSGAKGHYGLKQISTLVPSVDWILASVSCHLKYMGPGASVWELQTLYKAQAQTHHGLLHGVFATNHSSPRNTLLKPWVVTTQAGQIRLTFS